MKEHDKNPPNQTKDEKTGSFPEKKKFRIMIVKMIQNLKKPNGVTDRLDMH